MRSFWRRTASSPAAPIGAMPVTEPDGGTCACVCATAREPDASTRTNDLMTAFIVGSVAFKEKLLRRQICRIIFFDLCLLIRKLQQYNFALSDVYDFVKFIGDVYRSRVRLAHAVVSLA